MLGKRQRKRMRGEAAKEGPLSCEKNFFRLKRIENIIIDKLRNVQETFLAYNEAQKVSKDTFRVCL